MSQDKLTVTVEASWTGQGFVQRFGEIGGGDDDDTLGLLEPVELDQELIKRLLHVMLIQSARTRRLLMALLT